MVHVVEMHVEHHVVHAPLGYHTQGLRLAARGACRAFLTFERQPQQRVECLDTLTSMTLFRGHFYSKMLIRCRKSISRLWLSWSWLNQV